eukprot:158403-Pleurochrysis_carterae.AAC.1
MLRARASPNLLWHQATLRSWSESTEEATRRRPCRREARCVRRDVQGSSERESIRAGRPARLRRS